MMGMCSGAADGCPLIGPRRAPVREIVCWVRQTRWGDGLCGAAWLYYECDVSLWPSSVSVVVSSAPLVQW